MRIFVFLAFLVWASVLNAQTNSYSQDLSALRSILEKTPSYKSQIKGAKLDSFNILYNRLLADSAAVTNYQQFRNLSKLLFLLRDNHLGFYEVADYSHFKTKETIEAYVKTKAFLELPKYDIDIDSLKRVLAKKPADSLEGIYHYDRFYTVGLFKTSHKEYVGVVLDSDLNLWTKGQIAMHLYEWEPNFFKALYVHPLTKNFVLETNEKFRNQSLINSRFYLSFSEKVYSKQPAGTDYVNVPKDAPMFDLENINDRIQYLLIRTFQANTATMKQSAAFFDSIKNSITAANLIVDLRNNEGGAGKESRKFYELIEKFSSRGKVYLLLNNETLSQAEILTLRLIKLKNIVTAGQTSRGKLTYGSNYGKRQRLPSGKFEIYPTDMYGGSLELLKYEDYGINPDIILDDRSDWIQQVVDIIQKAK